MLVYASNGRIGMFKHKYTSVDALTGALHSVIRSDLPTTLRQIRRSFSSGQRDIVEAILRDFANQGLVQITGTGRKGSPVMISRPTANGHSTQSDSPSGS